MKFFLSTYPKFKIKIISLAKKISNQLIHVISNSINFPLVKTLKNYFLFKFYISKLVRLFKTLCNLKLVD